MPITILKQSHALAGLQDEGAVARPLSAPTATTRGRPVELEGSGNNRSGIWECTPGRFERQLANAEVMHILAGTCTFTPIGGEMLEISAGDTLFFPAHTTGVWDIKQTLTKVYVVMAQD